MMKAFIRTTRGKIAVVSIIIAVVCFIISFGRWGFLFVQNYNTYNLLDKAKICKSMPFYEETLPIGDKMALFACGKSSKGILVAIFPGGDNHARPRLFIHPFEFSSLREEKILGVDRKIFRGDFAYDTCYISFKMDNTENEKQFKLYDKRITC